MQGEVRGLPLFYSYIRLMREGWRRERERRGGGETGRVCVLLLERGTGISERREKRRRAEEENAGRRGVWKYIYEILGASTNRHCGNMDGGEPMLCYIVLETNESPMLRGRGEARLEEVVRETGR